MGELTLTGLDEDMLARLSDWAAAHGRSTEEEAGAILGAAIRQLGGDGRDVTKDELLALSAESRRQSGRLSVRSIDLLHDGRDERLANL